MKTMYNLFPQFLQNLFFHPCFLPILLFVIFFYKFLLKNPSNNGKNLPPSPPKLPIIGNLHQLGLLPHRSLHALSQQYGKLMFLYMGSKPTLVVSSADAAQKIMQTYDVIFSNRPKSRSASRIFYDCKDIAFSHYGEYWRQLRSISVTQLLNSKKVQSFRAIREEEVGLMVEKIKRSCSSVVNLREIAMTFTNDVICRASFGRKYSGDHGGVNFEKLLEEAMKLLGAFSVGDFIPWLGWIDRVNGLEGRLEKVVTRMDVFLEKVIQEHQNGLNTKKIINDESENGDSVKNFMEILLEIQTENKDVLSMDSIKAVILNMFAAGTDTTYTLMEWAILELLTNPEILKQLQEEVRKTVRGRKGRSVSEDDLEKLIYLKAVMKEALRLHPPAPLLIFRESSQDVKLDGFDIAAGTQVIVNAWAIQRDPNFWEEPEEFRPMRFLNGSTIDFKGQHFHYIPFGAGRRGCPGISFGMVDAELAIANLMYEFDWELPGGVGREKLDMTEIAGLTVVRRDPLMVIATPYACT